MRLVSWNCYRGECRSRAAALESLQPDLAVLQECGQPAASGSPCLWSGSNPAQGIGVVANAPWSLEPGPQGLPPHHSVFPVKVLGPQPFHLLAFWAQPRPTYVRAILGGLDQYRDFLKSAPSVMAGDFNSHTRWDSRDREANHTVLDRRLREEFGLVSAWHSFAAATSRSLEPATHYWRWNRNQPFHLDYCYIPRSWLPRLQSVTIGNYEDWAAQSDHRPLCVDVAHQDAG